MSRKSSLFDAPDADVVFQSADGVLFGVHRGNLQMNAEGFPPSEIIAMPKEICNLSESSDTLDILFQFIYPRRHPDLENLAFEEVAALAEAAEKYQISASIFSRSFLPNHAPEIISYANKHDYPAIVEEAAPFLFDASLVEVVKILPPDLIMPWFEYREEWEKILKEALVSLQSGHKQRYTDSSACEKCNDQRPLDLSVRSLFHLDLGAFPETECSAHWNRWREDVKKKVAEIPGFATFLRGPARGE
ncbi:hypothetical protein B0H13DRAFT_2372836 [Mycena leptocephala]|nr:hypothetical protein B0H13DRAFT_2372836 [Mycena leptocephala]